MQKTNEESDIQKKKKGKIRKRTEFPIRDTLDKHWHRRNKKKRVSRPLTNKNGHSFPPQGHKDHYRK